MLSCHIPNFIVYTYVKVYPYAGINPQLWEQAKKDNPDPKRLMCDICIWASVLFVVMFIITTRACYTNYHHLQHIAAKGWWFLQGPGHQPPPHIAVSIRPHIGLLL